MRGIGLLKQRSLAAVGGHHRLLRATLAQGSEFAHKAHQAAMLLIDIEQPQAACATSADSTLPVQ